MRTFADVCQDLPEGAMLTISAGQMAHFRAEALARFERELAEHALTFSPRHAASLGRDQLERCIRAAVAQSRQCGFTLRGPVRLWVELTFMFGMEFDTDVQLHQLTGALARRPGSDDREQLRSAGELQVRAVALAERIAGQDGALERAAVERFKEFSLDDLALVSDAQRLGMLRYVHPEKAEMAGIPALEQLFAKARALCETHELAHPSGAMAMTLLMFTFGQGCAGDPLFPWIADALARKDLAPGQRLELLHRMALRFVSGGQERD